MTNRKMSKHKICYYKKYLRACKCYRKQQELYDKSK